MTKNILPCICLIILSCTGCRESSPDRVVQAEDPLLSFRQDTLFHKQTPYSGQVITLFQNGDTACISNRREGLEHGPCLKWYPNGQLAESRMFVKGVKTGTHLGWWDDATPRFEYHFLNGEHEGDAREWYTNGRPYKSFHYKNGYEDGSQKMWWENGVIRANYAVRNGRRYGLIGLKLCSNPKDNPAP